MATYAAAMRSMFEQAAPFAASRGKAFIFRETAADHRHVFEEAEEDLLHPSQRRGMEWGLEIRNRGGRVGG